MSNITHPLPRYDWTEWLEHHTEYCSWHEILDDYADWMIAAGFNPPFDTDGRVYYTDETLWHALDILVSMGEMGPPDAPENLPR